MTPNPYWCFCIVVSPLWLVDDETIITREMGLGNLDNAVVVIDKSAVPVLPALRAHEVVIP